MCWCDCCLSLQIKWHVSCLQSVKSTVVLELAAVPLPTLCWWWSCSPLVRTGAVCAPRKCRSWEGRPIQDPCRPLLSSLTPCMCSQALSLLTASSLPSLSAHISASGFSRSSLHLVQVLQVCGNTAVSESESCCQVQSSGTGRETAPFSPTSPHPQKWPNE